MYMDRDILDDMERRQLIWFGYVSRIEEGWLPAKVFEWIPNVGG